MRDFKSGGGRFSKGGLKKFGGKGSGRFGRRDSDRGEMYPATCSDCGARCEVPFRPVGGKPVYCNNCFRKDESSGSRRDFERRGGFEKEMFSATCAECGDHCEVPFRPTGEKPVYCQNCFGKEKRRGSNYFDSRDFTGFGGNIRDEKPMYKAICAECGSKCEVPFKPSGEKPVYCEDCFGKETKSMKKEKFETPKNTSDYKKEFEQLNMKMDTILRRLESLSGQAIGKVAAPEKEKEAAPVTATPEKKKAAKKEKPAAVKKEKKTAVKKKTKK